MEREDDPSDPPRFLADEMLGTLSRWMRLAGFDVEYLRGVEDSEILRRLETSKRILLTRDRRLFSSVPRGRAVLVRSLELGEQFSEVVRALSLSPTRVVPLTRCSRCNGKLMPKSAKELSTLPPEGVLRRMTEFFECSGCGAVYWEGSHHRKIEETLSDLWRQSQ